MLEKRREAAIAIQKELRNINGIDEKIIRTRTLLKSMIFIVLIIRIVSDMIAITTGTLPFIALSGLIVSCVQFIGKKKEESTSKKDKIWITEAALHFTSDVIYQRSLIDTSFTVIALGLSVSRFCSQSREKKKKKKIDSPKKIYFGKKKECYHGQHGKNPETPTG